MLAVGEYFQAVQSCEGLLAGFHTWTLSVMLLLNGVPRNSCYRENKGSKCKAALGLELKGDNLCGHTVLQLGKLITPLLI